MRVSQGTKGLRKLMWDQCGLGSFPSLVSAFEADQYLLEGSHYSQDGGRGKNTGFRVSLPVGKNELLRNVSPLLGFPFAEALSNIWDTRFLVLAD